MDLMQRRFIRRAMRFALTGVFVTGVHAAIAVVFIRFLFPAPSLANGVAFLGATIVSYVVNTTWSFSTGLHGRTLFRFLVVSIAGFGLAMLVARIAEQVGLHYLTGIAAVAITIPPVTFLLHNFWTYR